MLHRTNRMGHFAHFLSIVLLVPALACASDANTTPQRRVALVIGNGAYESPELPRLGNPPNDAEDISAALRRFGFDVMARRNLGRKAMKDAIAEFGRRASNADAAFFYFAGHGVQIKNQNYLMPVDATVRSEADVADEGINISYALDELDNAHSRVNIVMLDACRDNPISGKFRGGGGRGLAAPSARPKGTVIVYATDPGNTAADGDGRNGLFTAGILAAFQDRDLSLSGVLTTASAKVETLSGGRQTPYVDGPLLVQKNFLFAAPPEVAPAAAATPPAAAVSPKQATLALPAPSPAPAVSANATTAVAGTLPPAQPASLSRQLPPEGALLAPSPSDDAAWQDALHLDTIAGYRLYLGKYPRGSHSTEAQKLILVHQQGGVLGLRGDKVGDDKKRCWYYVGGAYCI